jgi:hypothetical protein
LNAVQQALEEAKLDNWLGDDQILGTRAHTTTADVRKFPRAFQGKAGKPLYHGATASRFQSVSQTYVNSTAASEERALQEQRRKLSQHVLHAVSGAVQEQKRDELFARYKAAQTTNTPMPGTGASPRIGDSEPPSPRGWKNYEVEVEALGLAQLQRRIRESAHTRTRQQDARATKRGFRGASAAGHTAGLRGGVDVSRSFEATAGLRRESDGTGGAPRWGARRNYQDLMEAQVQANVLLQEHQFALPHITERQVRVLISFGALWSLRCCFTRHF